MPSFDTLGKEYILYKNLHLSRPRFLWKKKLEIWDQKNIFPTDKSLILKKIAVQFAQFLAWQKRKSKSIWDIYWSWLKRKIIWGENIIWTKYSQENNRASAEKKLTQLWLLLPATVFAIVFWPMLPLITASPLVTLDSRNRKFQDQNKATCHWP